MYRAGTSIVIRLTSSSCVLSVPRSLTSPLPIMPRGAGSVSLVVSDKLLAQADSKLGRTPAIGRGNRSAQPNGTQSCCRASALQEVVSTTIAMPQPLTHVRHANHARRHADTRWRVLLADLLRDDK